jgi:hypothetical protein
LAQPTGGRKKLPIDENRLITKKYKPHPTTQAEVRDCTKPLEPQELLNIVPSTKVRQAHHPLPLTEARP